MQGLDLAWFTRDDVLIITSDAQGCELPDTRVYPIAGLGTPGKPAPYRQLTEEYDIVVEQLTSLVAPTTWGDVGGVGAVRVVPNAVARSSRKCAKCMSRLKTFSPHCEKYQACKMPRIPRPNARE